MEWDWYTRPEDYIHVDQLYAQAYTYWLEQLTTSNVTKIVVENGYMYGSLTLDYEQLEREPQKIGHYFIGPDFCGQSALMICTMSPFSPDNAILRSRRFMSCLPNG